MFNYWLWASLPVYLLRILNAGLYSAILYSIIGLNTDNGTFIYILLVVTFGVILYIITDLRTFLFIFLYSERGVFYFYDGSNCLGRRRVHRISGNVLSKSPCRIFDSVGIIPALLRFLWSARESFHTTKLVERCYRGLCPSLGAASDVYQSV